MDAHMPQDGLTHEDTLRLTADVVASFVSFNKIAPSGISELVLSVHGALKSLGGVAAVVEEKKKPAVPISKSVQDDFIVCLEDGKKLKMLKRHLSSMYNMTPDDYRRKCNLPSDYPMVAPSYAARRSEFAKQIGLGKGATGRKPGKATAKTAVKAKKK